ncbi:MAG TPA: hypothetical protein PLH94_12150 [Fimbriimonadaceae bacterium]|nr:hypothetical protein [Fimbriimonadaceae bacterium]
MRHNDRKIIHPPLEVSVSWTPEEALELFQYLDQLSTATREEIRTVPHIPPTYKPQRFATNPA